MSYACHACIVTRVTVQARGEWQGRQWLPNTPRAAFSKRQAAKAEIVDLTVAGAEFAGDFHEANCARAPMAIRQKSRYRAKALALDETGLISKACKPAMSPASTKATIWASLP